MQVHRGPARHRSCRACALAANLADRVGCRAGKAWRAAGCGYLGSVESSRAHALGVAALGCVNAAKHEAPKQNLRAGLVPPAARKELPSTKREGAALLHDLGMLSWV